MPTANPRITITLRPELHAILRRLSAATGNSQSAIVSELLESSTGVFERMVHTLETAERIRVQGMAMPAQLQGSLEEAQSRIEHQLGLLIDEAPELAGPLIGRASTLLDLGEHVHRRGRRAGGLGGVPKGGTQAPGTKPKPAISAPISNRGVTPTRKGHVSRKHTGKGGS